MKSFEQKNFYKMKYKLIFHYFFLLSVIIVTTNCQTDVETLWEEFKQINGKIYGSLDEEFNR